jgi:hypothetical protein
MLNPQNNPPSKEARDFASSEGGTPSPFQDPYHPVSLTCRTGQQDWASQQRSQQAYPNKMENELEAGKASKRETSDETHVAGR